MQLAYALSPFPFFLLAWAGTRRLFPKQGAWEISFLSLPLGLSFILISVSLLGNLLHQIAGALILGSLLNLVVWLALNFFAAGTVVPLDWKFKFHRSDLPLIFVLLGTTTLVGCFTLKYALFDEMRMQGHIAVVESLIRGPFPPGFIAFPDIPFRYHYGFNLLAAVFAKAWGLSGYRGIDVATLLGWVALCGVLLSFLSALGVPRRGLGLGLLFVTFSGGLCWLLINHPYLPRAGFQFYYWQQMFIYWRAIHPNFVIYFFQHPMGMGVVLLLGSLRLFQQWTIAPRWALLLTSTLILGALSLAHAMLFVTLLGSLGLWFFLRMCGAGAWRWGWAGGLAVGLVAGALAWALGGFFQSSFGLEGRPILFSWPPGYLTYEYFGSVHPIPWRGVFLWYLGGFGLFLFLLPYALYRAFTRRMEIVGLLAIFCIFCFLLPQFFRYTFSWDIIKSFFGFELAGRLLICWAYFPWVMKKRGTALLAWVFVLFGMVTPLRLLGELGFKDPRKFIVPERSFSGSQVRPATGGYKKLLDFMNHCPQCYGPVYSTIQTSQDLAMRTGYPMLQTDYNTSAMGVSRQRIAERQEALKKLEMDPEAGMLQALQVRWVIFNCYEVSRQKPELQAFLTKLKADPQVKDFSFEDAERCMLALQLNPGN